MCEREKEKKGECVFFCVCGGGEESGRERVCVNDRRGKSVFYVCDACVSEREYVCVRVCLM